MPRTLAASLCLAVVCAGLVAEPALAQDQNSPSARELELIERAQTTGDAVDYRAYLREFPEGVFAELARIELGPLDGRGDPNQAASNPAVAAPQPNVSSTIPSGTSVSVGWDVPLAGFTPEVNGRTLAEIVEGSPLFSPVEGIPEELWKDQTCSNCHAWNRERLCTQAQVYLGQMAEQSLGKEHPLGGGLKQAMQAWAAWDCM